MELLKEANLPLYDEYIDKEIVSEITETLKEVSENLEKNKSN